MARALVTGGTGGLGRELLPRLAQAGYTVRVMSRRARPADADPAVEWARAALATGEGLGGAVADVDLVMHAASSPFRQTEEVDVRGTGRLLEAAAAAGVSHFFYISIVGIDRIPFPYYRHKLAAESLIEQGHVPWSALRATQFHTLIDRFLHALVRLPVALLPADLRFQPVDTGEVAERMVAAAADGPRGRLPDLGGPEVLTLGELARAWLKARGRRAWLIRLPLPGRAAAGFRRGDNCTPEHAEGTITWAQWLSRRYGGGV
ncbi:MAG: NAD(P)H-binding protein [Chloroflexi bacterium]|nr:NAD(P)H-binding protein [Chloroflexota bacterium]